MGLRIATAAAIALLAYVVACGFGLLYVLVRHLGGI